MSYKTVTLIGAGARGRIAYGDYVLKNQDKIRYVSVVEPDKNKRELCASDHKIEDKFVFEDEAEFFKLGKVCDAVVIAHQDKQHYKTVMKALELGYDILLEKPMSPDPLECIEMDAMAKKHGRLLMVCHVLRYTSFYDKLKSLIDSNAIGKMYGIDHVENIGNYHMAHSFVRGNWRNKEETSPIILAKSCHDMDIVTWLVNSKCSKVYSVGRLNYFRKENAPKESAQKCLDCKLNDSCRFSAKTVYLGNRLGVWPANTLCGIQTEEEVIKVLNNSSYGDCAWKVKDNNVCDHQVTAMSFESGVEATFTLTAFTHNQYRETRIYGSEGSIYASTKSNTITLKKHGDSEGCNQVIEVYKPEIINGGHGGGDTGLMEDFVNSLNQKGEGRTSSSQSMQSHIMSLAAEQSRLDKVAIEIDDYVKGLEEVK